jgi:hypothetical protein
LLHWKTWGELKNDAFFWLFGGGSVYLWPNQLRICIALFFYQCKREKMAHKSFCSFLLPKCAKNSPTGICKIKNFPGGYTPGPPFKGKGREELLRRGEGKGREGVGWDGEGRERKGEEGRDGKRAGGEVLLHGCWGGWTPLVIRKHLIKEVRIQQTQ